MQACRVEIFSRAEAGHHVRSLEGDIALSIVADHYRVIIGEDTDATTNTYAILETPSGKSLAHETFSSTTAGLARFAAWIGRRTESNIDDVLVSAEGTGS